MKKSNSEMDFVRIDIVAPLQAMQTELNALLAQTWTAHVNQHDYSGGWDVLPLRCQREHIHAHPVLQSFSVECGDDWEYLPIMQACPAMLNFLNSLQCPLKSVRLMRLKAGAEIKAHRDSGLGLAYGEVRLHLPLQTSHGVDFFCNQRRIPMQAGELWYFNADKLHGVRNHSSEDRINLVIDCRANSWLRERIQADFKDQVA